MKKNESMMKFARKANKTIVKYGPDLLIGFGIAGMWMSAVEVIHATTKAEKIVAAKKKEMGYTPEEKLPMADTAKAVWKVYGPVTAGMVMSTMCIIGAHKIEHRRTAAFATAYSLSESAFRDYSAKVIDVVGEKKEQTIRDEVAKEKIRANPPKSESIIVTGDGDTLCYDSYTGNYFKSNIELIRHAVNVINHRLLTDDYAALNDFYYEIHAPYTRGGEDVGWNSRNGLMDVRFSSQLTEKGVPCLVIEYTLAPIFDYDRA